MILFWLVWFADDEQIQSGRPGGRSDAQHQIDPGLWPLHVQLLRGRFGFFTYIEIGLQLYAFVSCFTPVWVSLHYLKLNEKKSTCAELFVIGQKKKKLS